MSEGLRLQLKYICVCSAFLWLSSVAVAQNTRNLTPLEIEIAKQQQRLSSSSEEERRDAVMKLGGMRVPAAARAALPGLKDPSPIVRATAAKAILWIGEDESVTALLPLLNDKDEFVRRETAYALGLTHSRNATAALTERLTNDKEAGVRGAAAVALGKIADEAESVPLVNTLSGDKNEFVLRAAAVALGQIRSRAGTAALVSALSNEKLPNDVRREAARSLGLIGDPSAEPALRAASTAEDPYLSRIAFESLKKLGRG
ncbi:MAG TPA: HEAT repeat domain-containing protein [Pyrinomonadaceae bacterium]|nr:HEAT repeat domain-containing protein [Pyrinomonadaceae bacterium]